MHHDPIERPAEEAMELGSRRLGSAVSTFDHPSATYEQIPLGDARFWLAAIADSSDDAIVEKDLNGIVTSWNRSAELMFSYTFKEIVGQPITCIIPLDRIDEEDSILSEVDRGGKIVHFETKRRCEDGRIISVSLSVSPIRDVQDTIIGVFKIAHDLTERDERERKLRAANVELEQANADLARHADALERSNADLDEFAHIASHDLKEPLRGLSNSARFLHEDYAEKFDQEGVGRLLHLGYLCQRMENIINDLLYFSRIGHQELGIQMTDLNEVIRDIEMMTETTLKERNASIVIPHQLPRVSCDKVRITEVFRNLIVNAIKYNDNPVRSVEVGYYDQLKTRYV